MDRQPTALPQTPDPGSLPKAAAPRADPMAMALEARDCRQLFAALCAGVRSGIPAMPRLAFARSEEMGIAAEFRSCCAERQEAAAALCAMSGGPALAESFLRALAREIGGMLAPAAFYRSAALSCADAFLAAGSEDKKPWAVLILKMLRQPIALDEADAAFFEEIRYPVCRSSSDAGYTMSTESEFAKQVRAALARLPELEKFRLARSVDGACPSPAAKAKPGL